MKSTRHSHDNLMYDIEGNRIRTKNDDNWIFCYRKGHTQFGVFTFTMTFILSVIKQNLRRLLCRINISLRCAKQQQTQTHFFRLAFMGPWTHEFVLPLTLAIVIKIKYQRHTHSIEEHSALSILVGLNDRMSYIILLHFYFADFLIIDLIGMKRLFGPLAFKGFFLLTYSISGVMRHENSTISCHQKI